MNQAIWRLADCSSHARCDVMVYPKVLDIALINLSHSVVWMVGVSVAIIPEFGDEKGAFTLDACE